MSFVELEAKAFKAEIALNKKAFLLDVREEYEFEDSNIGGFNMPMGEVLSHLDVLQEKGDIYVICKSGKRSKAVAYQQTKKLNLSKVYSCCGGIDAYTEL